MSQSKYKLHAKGYESACMLIEYKTFRMDDCCPTEGTVHPDDHLGVDKDGQYAYRVMGVGYLYPKMLEKVQKEAAEAGDTEVSEAACNLMTTFKSFPELAQEKSKKIKKHWYGSIIKDQEIITKLNALLPMTKGKAEEDTNGFWGIATVEQVDSDGDIIVVDGIFCDVDPEKNKTMPLLAGHKLSLPDGSPPEVGIVKYVVKTTYEAKPALAFYFSFALDENGEPLDDLVAKYYKRYKLGFTGSFSIGGEAMEEPERIETGYKFNKTWLYEISMVSVPANKDAIAITRSLSEEDMGLIKSLVEKIDALSKQVATLEGSIEKSVEKQFKPFEQRFDMMEATMVAKEMKPKKQAETGLADLIRQTIK